MAEDDQFPCGRVESQNIQDRHEENKQNKDDLGNPSEDRNIHAHL